MNKSWKYLGIGILTIFLIYHLYIWLFAFSGCPPSYDVRKMNFNPDLGKIPASVYITDEDMREHPYLKEAFEEGKRVILPTCSLADIIPGTFFGPNYAFHRMPFWERDDFIENYRSDSIWEYHGSYYKFVALAC